jgi:hypothetical protein
MSSDPASMRLAARGKNANAGRAITAVNAKYAA